MKTNKFTTQKLFCTLLFNLLVMGVFAQFTPNAAGAPDEPILEPEVEGASCETAIGLEKGIIDTYTFYEGQEDLYFEFTASSDSMFVVTGAESQNSEPFVGLIAYEVYLKDDCESLTQIYNESVDDSTMHYFEMTDLTEEESYLLVLRRDLNEDLPEVTFSMLIEDIYYNCPQNYNSPCGELIKNYEFNYLVGTFSGGGRPFSQVCDWRIHDGTPQIKGLGIPQAFAYMFIHSGSLEAIETTVNVTPDNYIVSLDVAATGTNPPPDELRVILRNNMTNTEQIIYTIPGNTIQPSTSTNPRTFQTKAICFSPTQTFDELIIEPYNSQSNTVYCDVYVNNVSLRNISLDAGADVTLNGCSDEKTIGPDCVLPGVSYSWSPTKGLSDPNIPNPTISGAQSGTYTLTMTSACTTITDQINVNFSGGSGIDKVIPDGVTASWLMNELNITANGNGLYSVNYMSFIVQGEFVIDEWVRFHSVDFFMGEGAKIIVDDGQFETSGYTGGPSKIIPCKPNTFWDGIYASGSDNGHIELNGSTTIRNSINGVVIEEGSSSQINNVNFVNNLTSVTFKKYSYMNYKDTICCNYIPLRIANCHFSANNTFAEEFGYLPNYAVKVINYHKDPNDNSMESLVVNNNTFDGTGGGLYIENSDVNVQLNGFHGFYKTGPNFPGNPSRSDLAIRIKGSQTVSGSKGLTINSNTFNNCYFGIETEDNFIYRIRNNTFNGSLALLSETGPGTNFLKMSNNFSDADPSTTQNQIENNTIKNVEKGIILETVSEFSILDNTFDMEVQALPSSYPQRTNKNSRAIYVNNYDIPLSTYDLNTPRYISRNQIKHSKVGIQSSFVSSLTISENNIFNSNDNMSSTCPSLSPFTCPPLNPFGIRVVGYPSLIEENEVSNELSLYTNNQPYQQSSDMMVGISVENTAALATMFIPGLYCNKIENTGVGMRFLGSNLASTQVVHNTMENHYYGFVLKNNGFIGDVGSDGGASDNEWKGSYTGSETLADDSDGSYCTLFVQNGGVYDPSINPYDRLNGGVAVQKDNSGNYPVSLNCSIPVQTYQDNSKPKQPQQNVSKSGGSSLNWGQQIKRGKMDYMIHAADSALMLDRQLLYYHLSKDTALLNDKKWKTFADSMKLTPMGRSMRQSQNSRSAINNFEANLISIDSIAIKIDNKDTLSQSDTLELKRIADLCPYYDGIAVYKARYLLHKLSLTVVLNDCERTQVNTSQKYIRIKNMEDTTKVLFSLYPNPSQQWVTVEYTVEEDQEIFFELYDVLGKRHFKEQMKNANDHRLNLEGMHQGMYFYRLVNNENILESGKLLIRK